MPETLTPAQREILSLFRRDLPDEAWEELRALVADFFARRAVASADRAWDERGYTDEDAERMLHGHDRRRPPDPDATPDP